MSRYCKELICCLVVEAQVSAVDASYQHKKVDSSRSGTWRTLKENKAKLKLSLRRPKHTELKVEHWGGDLSGGNRLFIKGQSKDHRTEEKGGNKGADPNSIIVSNHINDESMNTNILTGIDKTNILDAQNPPISQTWRPPADEGIENLMSSMHLSDESHLSSTRHVGIGENGIYRNTADHREYTFRNANRIQVRSLKALEHQNRLVYGVPDDGDEQDSVQQNDDQQNAVQDGPNYVYPDEAEPALPHRELKAEAAKPTKKKNETIVPASECSLLKPQAEAKNLLVPQMKEAKNLIVPQTPCSKEQANLILPPFTAALVADQKLLEKYWGVSCPIDEPGCDLHSHTRCASTAVLLWHVYAAVRNEVSPILPLTSTEVYDQIATEFEKEGCEEHTEDDWNWDTGITPRTNEDAKVVWHYPNNEDELVTAKKWAVYNAKVKKEMTHTYGEDGGLLVMNSGHVDHAFVVEFGPQASWCVLLHSNIELWSLFDWLQFINPTTKSNNLSQEAISNFVNKLKSKKPEWQRIDEKLWQNVMQDFEKFIQDFGGIFDCSMVYSSDGNLHQRLEEIASYGSYAPFELNSDYDVNSGSYNAEWDFWVPRKTTKKPPKESGASGL